MLRRVHSVCDTTLGSECQLVLASSLCVHVTFFSRNYNRFNLFDWSVDVSDYSAALEKIEQSLPALIAETRRQSEELDQYLEVYESSVSCCVLTRPLKLYCSRLKSDLLILMQMQLLANMSASWEERLAALEQQQQQV
jgi:hypothetical protein